MEPEIGHLLKIKLQIIVVMKIDLLIKHETSSPLTSSLLSSRLFDAFQETDNSTFQPSD